MLTVDATTAPPGEHQLWVIEADMEHGHATAGRATVYLDRDGDGRPYIESARTGGCYTDPAVIGGQVQAWYAEEHFIALFADEEAMRAGGQQLASTIGPELPIGVHRAITALGTDHEAGR